MSFAFSVGLNTNVQLNPICINVNTVKNGGWWSCGFTGLYFGIFSSNNTPLNFVEVLAYSDYAI